VVGDDAQSVYSLPRRGHQQHPRASKHDYPDAQVVKLEQNYRSTQTVLDAANAVIANNRAQKPKHLWTEHGQGEPLHVREMEDEHAEARYVAGEIERHVEGEARATTSRSSTAPTPRAVCSRTRWSATG
ncbi:MAG: 3'-5' exonuclease, partial [Thermoleophilaceae bacterium]